MPADAQGRPSPSTTTTSERPRSFFTRNSASQNAEEFPATEGDKEDEGNGRPTKWSMGVLNDPKTHEVPGSVLLLTGNRNEPLGLRNAPARTSHSSLPSQPPLSTRRPSRKPSTKTTKDGAIILDPQPDDSINDPLNWPKWRRDAALLSLGLYCMVGGGMTPILAAGFTNVAATYHVTTPQVALTTGLFMMGLGVGSVFASPTAILFGKRPVYLVSAIIFILTSIWCALSPSYSSLVVARVFQGISISPVECLPSATVAEIFFLHERAYRLGIYTLLLLGGKNLAPLASAAIIQTLGWRWVFWIVAMVVGFCGGLLFLFVPESFWDRSPVPKSRSTRRPSSVFARFFFRKHSASTNESLPDQAKDASDDNKSERDIFTSHNGEVLLQRPDPVAQRRGSHNLHVGFAAEKNEDDANSLGGKTDGPTDSLSNANGLLAGSVTPKKSPSHEAAFTEGFNTSQDQVNTLLAVPRLHSISPSFYPDLEGNRLNQPVAVDDDGSVALRRLAKSVHYTAGLRDQPRVSFVQQLKPYNGRMHYDNWLRVAIRPFILFCYPAVLWSAIVYSCSIGWLIVLSESVAVTYRSQTTYGFSALSTGLIYISPFIGGILGTAVAGKISDIIVRAMSKRNGGLYEPEFRLVMAIPITIATVIGLMGFGWSAQAHDAWIVPTVFFGIISFGCSLGSTTAITFCVDSYRQYAGEALVTLNFSKNIFHGLVFSLFFNTWLEADGSKIVFIWLGNIQLILMALTVPMYIFGKRARMWTVRKNLMEKF